MLEQNWSTEGVPEAESFRYWHDVVWEAFVPVAMRRAGADPFHGALHARAVGPIVMARIRSEAQTVSRTAIQIARRAGDVYFLNLPLTPGTSAHQAERSAVLAPGDFAVVDSARPFELAFPDAFDQISLVIPHDLLAPRLADPMGATGRTISGQTGVGALVSTMVRSLQSAVEPLDRQAAREVSDHLAGMIALAAGHAPIGPRPASRVLLTQAILDEIDRSLTDPSLSPASVAGAVGVSTRYLHRLLADRGPSFGRLVLGRRLERCHQDLLDPSRAHWTVTDIAVGNGFRDPSYLSRAFKRRYGIAPSELRQARC